MSKSCTDCFWCKINRSKGYIRCIIDDDNEGRKTFSHWENDNGTEKIIRLRSFEIKTSFIEWRDQFKLAEECSSMKSMV